MKNLNELNKYRVPFMGSMGDEGCGLFYIPKNSNEHFTVIASNGLDWEHVSVSLHNRCPMWDDMCKIKDMFFNEDEVVMQLHPAKKDYVNNHPYCLHLWRPLKDNIPLPPVAMV